MAFSFSDVVLWRPPEGNADLFPSFAFSFSLGAVYHDCFYYDYKIN